MQSAIGTTSSAYLDTRSDNTQPVGCTIRGDQVQASRKCCHTGKEDWSVTEKSHERTLAGEPKSRHRLVDRWQENLDIHRPVE